MSLLHMLDALSETQLGVFMRDSSWAFATVEMIHLIAMALLGGMVLFVDLRLLNVSLTSQPARTVARDLLPYTASATIVMLATGLLLWMAGPVHYWLNAPFRVKMLLFLLALLVHFGLLVRVSRADDLRGDSPRWHGAAAVLSLLFWCGTGIAGRAIGYF